MNPCRRFGFASGYHSYWIVLIVLALSGLTWAGTQEAPVGLKEPAHLKDAHAVLDLRRAPPLTGGSRLERTAHYCKANFTRMKPNQVILLAARELAELGWSEVPDARRTQLSEITTAYGKQGYLLLLNLKGLSDTDMLLQLRGNVDARTLPRAADATDAELQPDGVSYRTREKPEAVRELLRRELTRAGWHAYSPPPLPGQDSEPDSYSRFLQNGMAITAFIYANDGVTSVHQMGSLLPVELPIPSGARDVQFQEKPLFLQYRTTRGLAETLAACEHDLNELGWKRLDSTAGRAFQAPNQPPLYLDAQPSGEGTLVRLAPKPLNSP